MQNTKLIIIYLSTKGQFIPENSKLNNIELNKLTGIEDWGFSYIPLTLVLGGPDERGN